MDIEPTNLFQIRQLGLEVLSRELGPVAMIRFLQQYEVAQEIIREKDTNG